MKPKRFLSIGIACVVIFYVSVCWADSQLPFAIFKDEAVGKLGNKLYVAICKDDFRFLIVATTEMKKGERIPSSEMYYVVLDESGAEYEPVAFGLPSKIAPEPFMIQGFKFSGNIENGDVERTIMALYFLVPKKSKVFELRDLEGKVNKLAINQNWNAPEAMRIRGFKSYGSVTIGTPSVDSEGWEGLAKISFRPR